MFWLVMIICIRGSPCKCPCHVDKESACSATPHEAIPKVAQGTEVMTRGMWENSRLIGSIPWLFCPSGHACESCNGKEQAQICISHISHGMLMPEACCRGSERFSVRWHRGGPVSQTARRGASESGPASAPMAVETSQDAKLRSAQNLTRSRSSPPEDALQYHPPIQPQHLSQSVPPDAAGSFPHPGLNSIKRSSSFDGRTNRPAFVDGERLLATEGDAYWVDEEPAAPTGLKVMPL